VLAGGAESTAKVTEMVARGDGEPWLAVGAVSSSGPPASMGTPVPGAGPQGTTATAAAVSGS
jgi:hypothetical protein